MGTISSPVASITRNSFPGSISDPINGSITDGGGFVPIITPNQYLFPGVSWVRASTAWDFNSSGILESNATNIPRWDYNPSTLAARGFLIEEQRTNLFLNSTTLSTQNVTVTAAQHTLSFYGTGTVTLSGVSTAGPLAGTGANDLVQLTFTPTAGTLTCTVSGTVTYANLTLGAFAGSRIITAGSQVTRSPDIATISNLATISYSQTQGTIYWEGSLEGLGGSTPTMVVLNDGTEDNRITLYYQAFSDNKPYLVVTTGGVTQAAVTTTVVATANTTIKLAASWSANSFRFAVNGVPGTEDTSGTVPTVTQLQIGRRVAGSYLNGWIKQLGYSPIQQSQAFLNAITA